MQKVKMIVRQVGVPNKELDIISSLDFEEYVDYQLTSQGYTLHTSHYLGEVRDGSGSVVGYKVMQWYVKDEPAAKAK